MKRVVISIIILSITVVVCGWSVYHVGVMQERMQAYVEAINTAIEAEDYDETVLRVEELSQFWREEEQQLMHIVRHAQIDGITLNVSRLNALAKHNDTAQLTAELSSIAWQVSHIQESERPSLKNMF